MAEDWEQVLFCPPAWPYEDDDATAPEAHPTIKQYGYDIRQLDALPIQDGYEQTEFQRPETSETEAKTYYTQFEVFRDVMLDKEWGARQKDMNSEAPAAGLLEGGKSRGWASGSQRRLARHRQRRSSATSCMTQTSSSLASKQKPEPKEKKKGGRRTSIAGVSPGATFAVLRVPLLALIWGAILVELLVYLVVRQIVRLYEQLYIWQGKRGALFRKMKYAHSYAEWMEAAQQIDDQRQLHLDQDQALSRYYDAPLLRRITNNLRQARAQIDAARDEHERCAGEEALCDLLRQGALRANAAGWENREIWSRAYSGPPKIVADYVAETVASIEQVRRAEHIGAPAKLRFFRQAARQQGRMALCLSGGAAMGWKHLGVARSLLEGGRLPRVISGASAGSLVAALLGTHTDDELREIIRPELTKYITPCHGPDLEKLRRWLRQGHYFDPVEWAPRAQVFTRGDTTFREAFERTGKILNISCTPQGRKYAAPKLMNHVSTPDVIIWTAVLASACLPGVLPPMVLLMKTRDGHVRPYTGSGVLWRDGSFRNDIPINDLRETLNVQFTVVSQVNPHVSMFFYDRDGSIGQPPARRLSSMWRGGFILSAIEHALKLDIRKWLRLLSDLNLVPLMFNQDWTFVWLQKFDGNVTILPSATFSEYFRLLKDPTYQSAVQSIDEGMVATWPKLKIIRSRMQIEDAITEGWLDAHMEVGAELSSLVNHSRMGRFVRSARARPRAGDASSVINAHSTAAPSSSLTAVAPTDLRVTRPKVHLARVGGFRHRRKGYLPMRAIHNYSQLPRRLSQGEASPSTSGGGSSPARGTAACTTQAEDVWTG